jgi:hypothetical protein
MGIIVSPALDATVVQDGARVFTAAREVAGDVIRFVDEGVFDVAHPFRKNIASVHILREVRLLFAGPELVPIIRSPAPDAAVGEDDARVMLARAHEVAGVPGVDDDGAIDGVAVEEPVRDGAVARCGRTGERRDGGRRRGGGRRR